MNLYNVYICQTFMNLYIIKLSIRKIKELIVENIKFIKLFIKGFGILFYHIFLLVFVFYLWIFITDLLFIQTYFIIFLFRHLIIFFLLKHYLAICILHLYKCKCIDIQFKIVHKFSNLCLVYRIKENKNCHFVFFISLSN